MFLIRWFYPQDDHSLCGSSLCSAQFRIRLARVLCVILILTAAVLITAPSATALSTSNFTGKEIASDLTSGMKSIFKLLRYISYGVAVVYVAIVGYKMLAGGQRGMEEGAQGIIKVVFFLALILLAPLVAKKLVEWFTSGSVNNYSQFGDLN